MDDHLSEIPRLQHPNAPAGGKSGKSTYQQFRVLGLSSQSRNRCNLPSATMAQSGSISAFRMADKNCD
jgi:hypothetical protein